MTLLAIPRRGELRTLDVVEKPNARGAIAFSTFLFLRVLRWLGNGWARQVYEDFVQEIEGVIYWYDARPSESLRGHEATHDWQRRTHGRLRYLTWYYNPCNRMHCRHLESMACGYEVAIHGRQAEERARMLVGGPYWLRAEVGPVAQMIEAYAERFREAWKP